MSQSLLLVPMPPDYRLALDKRRLRMTVFTVEEHPTAVTYMWIVGQTLLSAYKHSNVSKTHWIVVQDKAGNVLVSVPGALKLGN